MFIVFYLLALSMDAMLRVSIESNISLSKILIVFGFIPAIRLYGGRTVVFVFSFLGVLLYSSLVAIVGEYGVTNNLIRFNFHALLAASCFYFGYILALRLGVKRAYYIYCWFFWIVFIASVLFYYFSYTPPNIVEKTSVIRGWFWNENDLAMLFVALSFLVYNLGARLGSAKKSLIILFLAIYVAAINEARVVLLASAIFLGLKLIKYFVDFLSEGGGKGVKNSLFIIFIALASLFSYAVLIYLKQDALLDPFFRFVTLDPYGIPYGSIYNRTDAAIYAIYGFFDSYGFGIGLGNSINLIVEQKYGVILSAGSMHNLVAQMIVELGMVFILGFIIFFKKSGFILFVLFWMPFLLNSVSQSSGIFSNYVFFFVFGSAFLFVRKKLAGNMYN